MSTSSFNQSQATRAFLLVSLLYLSLGPVQAAEMTKGDSVGFAKFDLNHDGYIDRKEASVSPIVSSWMKTADRNKDGKLSEAEFLSVQSSDSNTLNH